MSKSFLHNRFVISLLCSIAYLNQVHATPEAEDLSNPPLKHSKADGWQSARSALVFQKEGDESLTGILASQCMKLEYPHDVLKTIRDLCMVDCRAFYALEEEVPAALQARRRLVNTKIQIIQHLLSYNPQTPEEILRYRKGGNLLTPEQKCAHDALESAYYSYTTRAYEAISRTAQCRALSNELPDMTQCKELGVFPHVIKSEDLYLLEPAILKDWHSFTDNSGRNFKGLKRRLLLADLMESYQTWSVISPEVAINRMQVIISICKNAQMRNYYLAAVYQQQKESRNPTPALRETLAQTCASLSAYVEANFTFEHVHKVDRRTPERLARDPFHRLMKITPTPLDRAYFACLLRYDPQDIKEYLSPDFPLDLNQSQESIRIFFRDLFPGYMITPYLREHKMRDIFDSLKIMYHREKLDEKPTEVLYALNFWRHHSPFIQARGGIMERVLFPCHEAVLWMSGELSPYDQEAKKTYEQYISKMKVLGDLVLRASKEGLVLRASPNGPTENAAHTQ